jgi:hypothetical protein
MNGSQHSKNCDPQNRVKQNLKLMQFIENHVYTVLMQESTEFFLNAKRIR